MTTPQPSPHALPLTRANRPGTNDRQQPPRRVQMANAVTYAVLVLEEAAAGNVDPDRLRLAAAGLTAAAQRLNTPKPRRKPSQQLPRPGHATRVAREVSLEDVTHAAEAARALSGLLAGRR